MTALDASALIALVVFAAMIVLPIVGIVSMIVAKQEVA